MYTLLPLMYSPFLFYSPVVPSFVAGSANINGGWGHEGPAMLIPVTATGAVAGGSCLRNSSLTVLLIMSSRVARAFVPVIGPAVGTFPLAVPAIATVAVVAVVVSEPLDMGG